MFRGPRFKMGLCEGVPKTITPDHQGRADYHGAFVNQAARYADAAAHGGQVVTDVDLAVKVLQLWRMSSSGVNFSGSSNAVALVPQPWDMPESYDGVGGGGRWRGLLPGSPAAAAAAAANGGGSGGGGGAEDGVDVNEDQGSEFETELTLLPANSVESAQTQLQQLQHYGVGAGAGGGNGASSDLVSPSQVSPTDSPTAAAAAADVAVFDHNRYSDFPLIGTTIAVPTEAVWLGSYLFKGNPNPVEMVGFSPTVLMGRSYPGDSPKGKGVRVVQRVGGMDRAVVQLPAVVEGPPQSGLAVANKK